MAPKSKKTKRPPKLSPTEVAKRAPRPPNELVDTLQNRTAPTSGRLLATKQVKPIEKVTQETEVHRPGCFPGAQGPRVAQPYPPEGSVSRTLWLDGDTAAELAARSVEVGVDEHTLMLSYISSGVAKTPKRNEKRTVVIQNWEESERGWGTRPDGYTVHIDLAQHAKYVADYYKKHNNRPYAPDTYTRTCDSPQTVEVDGELFEKIKAATLDVYEGKPRNGIWGKAKLFGAFVKLDEDLF